MGEGLEFVDHRLRADDLEPVVAVARNVLAGQSAQRDVPDRVTQDHADAHGLLVGAALGRRDLVPVAPEKVGHRGLLGGAVVRQPAVALVLGFKRPSPALGFLLRREALRLGSGALAPDLSLPLAPELPDGRHARLPDCEGYRVGQRHIEAEVGATSFCEFAYS